MVLISTGLTAAVLGVTSGAALLLGTAICPTDPVLASSVVTGKPAEEDLPARDRQILSMEWARTTAWPCRSCSPRSRSLDR